MTHSYDAFNQWITRTVDTDGDGGSDPIERTAFVHDAGQIVLQFDDTGIEALDAADLSHRYLWGPAVDQLLADEAVESVSSAGETLWPLADHLGTIRDIVDDDADLRKHIEYDSFGNITGETYYDESGTLINNPDTHSEAIDQLFAYTGSPLDQSTGLQNNLHRWYDAAIGQWASEDPFGFAASDANLRRYVGNTASSSLDPSGLEESWGNWFLNDIYIPAMNWQIETAESISSYMPFGYGPMEDGIAATRELITVLENTSDDSALRRVYVAGGTHLATITGVRGVSDACATHDAVWGHVQDTNERIYDGVTGSVTLVTTAAGIRGSMMGRPVGVTNAVDDAINPRLLERVTAWRAYRERGGQLPMQSWVRQTQGAPYGTGFRSGYAKWIRSIESTHGNSALSSRPATLYGLYDECGNFLKWGVSQNPAQRYTSTFMRDKYIIEYRQGTRSEILRVERDLVETSPGPLNHEKWVGLRRGK